MKVREELVFAGESRLLEVLRPPPLENSEERLHVASFMPFMKGTFSLSLVYDDCRLPIDLSRLRRVPDSAFVGGLWGECFRVG